MQRTRFAYPGYMRMTPCARACTCTAMHMQMQAATTHNANSPRHVDASVASTYLALLPRSIEPMPSDAAACKWRNPAEQQRTSTFSFFRPDSRLLNSSDHVLEGFLRRQCHGAGMLSESTVRHLLVARFVDANTHPPVSALPEGLHSRVNDLQNV
eukprot:137062-Chlamydomonas_euryale.AAC.3